MGMGMNPGDNIIREQFIQDNNSISNYYSTKEIENYFNSTDELT